MAETIECQKCNVLLEIFAHAGKEIYICPVCMSAFLPNESCLDILKYFSREEAVRTLLAHLTSDAFGGAMKERLNAEKNLACPRCKNNMEPDDLNKKIRFFVNRCIFCDGLWIAALQIPLVAVVHGDTKNPEDVRFRNDIKQIYEAMATGRSKATRSIDDIIAPYVAIPLSLLGHAFPIGDTTRIKRTPYATWGMIGACCFIFLVSVFADMVPAFSLIAEKVFANGEWYRFMSYAFLHGGIVHLLGNMWFLWIFGRGIEDTIGWKRYLVLFMAGTVMSAALFVATVSDKTLPCVGASGAISAIIGAYLVLLPRSRIEMMIVWKMGTYRKKTSVPAMAYILTWIIYNLIFALIQSAGTTVGVAFWGHIGGFTAGIVFAEVIKNLKRG